MLESGAQEAVPSQNAPLSGDDDPLLIPNRELQPVATFPVASEVPSGFPGPARGTVVGYPVPGDEALLLGDDQSDEELGVVNFSHEQVRIRRL